MGAHARKAPKKKFRSPKIFLNAVFKSPKELIEASDLDVLLLRNDPSEDLEDRPWAQNTGIVFGQLAQKDNVIVLNDPNALARATNKMYFQYFPKSIRPSTIVTRSLADIESFYKEHKKNIVLKPLQGSGGKNVFLVNEDNKNLKQIVEAIGRDGI